ncbi:MAG: hypothetical protein UMV23_07015, partial [Halanaerobium sp.]|nr:hypothetical protein [Halanaerobium sp.]
MLEEAYNIPGIFLAAIISTLATFFFRRRYHHVVFLQVLLLPVALIEPSPSDIIFAFILLYSFSLGVIDLVKIKGQGIPILLLSGFLVINGISFCNVTDYSQGLKFIMITIYLFLYAIFIFLYACPKKIFSLLKGYVLGASSAAVMGIMGYCGIFPALFMFDPFRAKALFKGPN